MTPEQIERNMEFILESQANSAVRMDRLEASFKEQTQSFQSQMQSFKERMEAFQEKLDHQRENVNGLIQTTQSLLIISNAELARIKRLEGRGDGIEEMTRFLRELIEAGLRPPGKPPSDN